MRDITRRTFLMLLAALSALGWRRHTQTSELPFETSGHEYGAFEVSFGDRTFYVDTRVPVSGDGSLDHPFRTLNEAAHAIGPQPTTATHGVSIMGWRNSGTIGVKHNGFRPYRP